MTPALAWFRVFAMKIFPPSRNSWNISVSNGDFGHGDKGFLFLAESFSSSRSVGHNLSVTSSGVAHREWPAGQVDELPGVWV